MVLRLLLALAGVQLAAAASLTFSIDAIPKLDVCGVCDGMDMSCTECTSFVDCNGECGGTALVDECGVCGGDSSSCTGCLDVHACNLNVYAIVSDDSLCTYGASGSSYVVVAAAVAGLECSSSLFSCCAL